MSGAVRHAAALAVAVGVLCASSVFARQDVLADLASARSLWTGSRPASYQYTLRIMCKCPAATPAPHRFRIENGKPIEAPAGIPASYRTVDAMFAFIESKLKAKPAKADVIYDVRRGYPVKVQIDPSAAPDDEIVLEVWGFAVLPSNP
jgi:hypothetical protein